MASFYGEKERKKALQLKKLQQIILRAVFNGHRHPASEAIQILSAHFDEGPPHDGRQLLDFFPEKDRVSFFRTMLLLAHFKTAILSRGNPWSKPCKNQLSISFL